MSTSSAAHLKEWLTAVEVKLGQYSQLFLHMGALFDPAHSEVVLAKHFGVTPIAAIDAIDPESDARIGDAIRFAPTILHGLENIGRLETHARCRALGRLRALAQEREPGSRLLLVSRVPALSLDGCPGSSVVIDSKRMYPASEMLAIDGAADGVLDEVTAAIIEAGPQVASWLEEQLCFIGRNRCSRDDIDPRIVDALRGSGLAVLESNDEVRLMPFLSDSQRLEASSKATRLIVDPPAETSPVFLHLWHIERRARLVIVAMADQSGRTVHEMLTSEVSKRVKGRSLDAGHGDVPDTSVIANPQDWLTLEEMLEVIERYGSSAPLNYGVQWWKRMVTEIAPIRNRMAHMRLLRQGDAVKASRWAAQVPNTASLRWRD